MVIFKAVVFLFGTVIDNDRIINLLLLLIIIIIIVVVVVVIIPISIMFDSIDFSL